ncbi:MULTISPECIES: hypothetical protein [Bifidobacterium]|uniref:Uncharacterized protein n=2 Tax=Bifidobacterium TaxID=1678 RepID=A0A261FTI2_9BIFI|nr:MULTISPECIES: hypothetical protein [Bifidobacterium]OZG62469.1 hypothetical protein BLEM_1015 [Bifidobacterium lemurum]OZG69005.1 hypothetical protein BEUL_0411 [Bifidobacterium eulemuris]QOL31466.1 hypothetical protein BE0216_02575 [Bifidobacterium eulemuris]QOL33811.1 hypothetical protein BL8807_08505 [Bifidobacterium lemurum]
MSKHYFDDFRTQTIEKMAGAMEDMTYAYQQTRVPKKHYKDCLSKPIEEMMEASVEVNLIQPYINMIKTMLDENPKSFYKALLCVDAKISMSSVRTSEWEALEIMWHEKQNDSTRKTILPKTELDRFHDLVEHSYDELPPL